MCSPRKWVQFLGIYQLIIDNPIKDWRSHRTIFHVNTPTQQFLFLIILNRLKCRKFHWNLNESLFFLVKHRVPGDLWKYQIPAGLGYSTLNICSDNHIYTPKIKNIRNDKSKRIIPGAKRKASALKLHMYRHKLWILIRKSIITHASFRRKIKISGKIKVKMRHEAVVW